MYYNIAFDVVTLVIVFGILTANMVMKARDIDSSRAFKTCIILLAISTIFDILAAITGGDVFWDSDELNVYFETVYMCTGLYSLYAVFLSVASRINYDSRKASQVIFAFVSIYTFLLIFNIPTRILFDITDGKYSMSLLFYVAYSIPILVMILTFIILLRNRKNLEKKIFIAMLIAVSCPIVGVLIQFVWDRLILIQFGLALTVLILLFIWETPDSKKLEEAVLLLEETRAGEERSRREAELADKVKTVFLSNVSGELITPIEEIQMYANEIKNQNAPEGVAVDAEQIIGAGEQFKAILDKINKDIKE